MKDLIWKWHLGCFVCLFSVDFFLLSSWVSCKVRMLALVGITKNGGVCFDCRISVFHSVCVSQMGYFNVTKPLSCKALWVLGETQWSFSGPSPSPSSPRGVSIQGASDWCCCSPVQGLPGLCRMITPTPNAYRGVLLVVTRMSAAVPPSPFRGKTLSHQVKCGGRSRRQACWPAEGKKVLLCVLPLTGMKMSCSPAAWLHLGEEGGILPPPDSSHWLVGGGVLFLFVNSSLWSSIINFLYFRHYLRLNDRLLCLIWNCVHTLDVMNVNILTLCPQLISKGWNSSAEARFSLQYPPNYRKKYINAVFLEDLKSN